MEYEDTKTLVFRATKKSGPDVHLQAWVRGEHSLTHQYEIYRREVARVDTGAYAQQDGSLVQHHAIDEVVDGQFWHWRGGCVSSRTHNGDFCDFELVGECNAIVVYLRFFMHSDLGTSLVHLREVLASVRINSPSSWGEMTPPAK